MKIVQNRCVFPHVLNPLCHQMRKSPRGIVKRLMASPIDNWSRTDPQETVDIVSYYYMTA